MKKLANHFRSVDFFSVTYSPAISEGLNYSHSSILGGIISLIIGALSLLYCAYYLYLWQSGSLLPKVAEDINKFQDDFTFGEINNHITVIAYDNDGESVINPFKGDELVIMPLIFDLANGEYKALPTNFTHESKLDIDEMVDKNRQFIILFSLCKEEYLMQGYKCASDEVKQNYFGQYGNVIYAQVEFTTINPSTFEHQQFFRTYSIFIHSNAELCSEVTLHYQLNRYQIDRAFLFSSGIQEHNYISDSLNYIQYGQKNYCDKYYLPDTYGAYWILFQQQYHTVQIGYPSISEVFAAIGSIISILFSVKYLITILNLSQMRESVLDDIMKQYYPEMKRFQIIKNFCGKIKQVKFEGMQVELSGFLSFQKQVHSQMACKLNYKNLLYEMSRLQFIIMSMKRRSEILKVHSVGIKVPIKLSESGQKYLIDEGCQQQIQTLNVSNLNAINQKFDVLSINDALILSPYSKKINQPSEIQSARILDKCNSEVELNQEADFYDVNYINQNGLSQRSHFN